MMPDIQYMYKNNDNRVSKFVGGQIGADSDVAVGKVYTVCTVPEGVTVLRVIVYGKGLLETPFTGTLKSDKAVIPDVTLSVTKGKAIIDTAAEGVVTPEDVRIGIEVGSEVPTGAYIYVGVEYIDLDIAYDGQRVRAKQGDIA